MEDSALLIINMVTKHTIFSANNQVVDNTKSWSIYMYMLIN